MNSQNSPHCCLPCVDNCVLIALMSCKRKRTKSTSCENKTKVKVADPCSLRSSAPTTIATALASSRGSSDVPDGVCTPSHDVALLIQRCDSVLAQHGAQGADQHLAAPRRVHTRGLWVCDSRVAASAGPQVIAMKNNNINRLLPPP